MRAASLLLVTVLLAPTVAATFPVAPEADALQRTLAWIRDRTRADGCIGAETAGACGHATTRDVVIALSALGADPRRWTPQGASPIDYLRDHRADLETEPGDCDACRWAKTIVALEASNENPRTFGGYDYVARLLTYFDNVQMGGANQVNDDAWSLFAFAGLDAPPTATMDRVRAFLTARQNPADGGWTWTLGAASEPWGTATVLLALLSSGTPPADDAVARAVAFLRSQARHEGLFLQDNAPSSETTAIAAQALRAAGEDPSGAAWTRDGRSLIDGMLAMQAADGSFAHNAQGGSRFLATTQVPAALRGLPYPFRPPLLSLVGSDEPAQVGRPVVVQAETADPDAGPVTVEWSLDGEGAGQGGSWRGTFDAVGSHLLRVRATDGEGATRSLETTIDVEAHGPAATPTSVATLEAREPSIAPAAKAPEATRHDAPTLAWTGTVLVLAALAHARRRT